MARLILLNGGSATGKSTLARRYVADHPLALCLDIDSVRGMLGAWLDDPTSAGLLARRMALAMASVALADRRDVIVPQLLGRPEFLLQLESLAGEAGVPFVEVLIRADADDAAARLAARSAGGGEQDRHNQQLVDRSGGGAELAAATARVAAVMAERPASRTIHTRPGQVDAAYTELIAIVSELAP